MSTRMELDGLVVKKLFGVGSKSERVAVFLQTNSGDYVLRRQGGLAFSDPELETLVGKRIRCTGTLVGYTFLMSDYTELGNA